MWHVLHWHTTALYGEGSFAPEEYGRSMRSRRLFPCRCGLQAAIARILEWFVKPEDVWGGIFVGNRHADAIRGSYNVAVTKCHWINEISDIGKILHISRAKLYRYINTGASNV
jgi:hypothetical protein